MEREAEEFKPVNASQAPGPKATASSQGFEPLRKLQHDIILYSQPWRIPRGNWLASVMPTPSDCLDPSELNVLNLVKFSNCGNLNELTAITSTERFALAATPPPGHHLRELNAGVLRLLEGGVIAIPTDTLFGLAADVLNEEALSRVFDIKGRPAELALPVLVGDWEQVGMVAKVESDAIECLAAEFWPGSLTMVLPRREGLSPVVTGGRDTVAVRMPSHWVPLNVAANLGSPISGTSANRSGEPDLKSLDELRNSLGDRVDAIIEAGPHPGGVQSTIVDMTSNPPRLIREGATSFDEVLKVWASTGEQRLAGDTEGGRHG